MIPGRVYSVGDFGDIAIARKWAIILPFVLVTAATALISARLPDRYRSETLILVVPQRIPEEYVRAIVTMQKEDRLAAISQQILSRTRLERIINDFALYRNLAHLPKDDMIAQMRRDISVQVVEGDAFQVAYEAADAPTATKVTDRLAALFIEENLKDREVLAKGTSAFLQSQLEDARRRLVEHERRIEEFRREHAGELPSQLESNLQVIQNTQVQLQLLADTINRDRDRRLLVDRSLRDLTAELNLIAVPVASDGTGGSDAAPLPVQLAAARSTLAGLETRLKAEHPNVIRQRRVVETLERQVEQASNRRPGSVVETGAVAMTTLELNRRNRIRELQSEVESLDRQLAYKTAEENRLRSVIADYQSRVEAVPARESEMIALTRDYETLRGIYTSLLTKEEDSRIAENLERRQISEQYKILDPASRPDRPFRPNRPLINVGGAFAGLLLGLCLAGVLEYRDVSLKTDADVQVALGAPILAMIPVLTTTADKHVRRRKRTTAAAALLVVLALTATVAAVMRTFLA